MVKPKGGRGHTVPYKTTHVRIPMPLKEEIQLIIDSYREAILSGDKFIKEQQLLTLDEAKVEAKKILASKQSARKSVIKLLTALYRAEISDL